LNGANVTVSTDQEDFQKAVLTIGKHRRLAERRSEVLRFCVSAAELDQCKKDGQFGMVMALQHSKPVEDSLEYLRIFYDMGLRVLQLTYNMQGYIGSGCCERHDAGLSSFGLEVVDECRRLGILVDLSHCADKTSWDAVRHAKGPVACTHSGAYAFCPAYGRNKPDDLLKAVVDTGGVVGAPFIASFVKRNPVTHEVLQATVEDVLDQVDYMVRLLGVSNVGLGSDMSNYFARTLEMPALSAYRLYRPLHPEVFGVGPTDRYDPFPIGLDSHAKLLNVTRGLVRRGYKDNEIKGILGGNWLRLFRDVWRK
jgi:membrane dipeptidase